MNIYIYLINFWWKKATAVKIRGDKNKSNLVIDISIV